MYISMKPVLFSLEGIEVIKKHHPTAIYMGPWCIKNREGAWVNDVVEVFYEHNPDRSKGHSNYFGIFKRGESVYICNAESAFSEPIYGSKADNDEVVVSRFRHDFVNSQDGSTWIDGGRDYWRTGNPTRLVEVTVVGPQFIFEEKPVEPNKS